MALAPLSAEPQVSIRLPSRALNAVQVGAESLDSSAIALHAVTPKMEHCSEDWKFEEAAAATGGLLCGCAEHADSTPTKVAARANFPPVIFTASIKNQIYHKGTKDTKGSGPSY